MPRGLIGKLVATIGVRSRLSLLALVAIAPLFALLLASAVADRQIALDAARVRVLDRARLAAESQDDILRQAFELLAVLRRMPELTGVAAQCRATLRAMARDHPQFRSIGIVGPDGMILCDSLLDQPRLVSDTTLLREAMAPDAPADILSKFKIGRVTGKPTIVVAAPLPPAAWGQPGSGMAVVTLNLDWFSKMTAEEAASSDRVALVIDSRTGTVLGRSPDPAHLTGRAFPDHPLTLAMVKAPRGGTIAAPGLDGMPRVFGFAPLGGSGNAGLMIAVGEARAAVLADANQRLVVGTTLAVLAALAAAGAAWLFGDLTQLRPIRALVDTARTLGAGDLDARAKVAAWQAPEFRALGDTLAEMASAIELVQRNLSESESRLRLLAENATDLIIRVREDGMRLYASPASRRLLGFEPAEMLCMSSRESIHPDDVGFLEDPRAFGSDEPVTFTYRMRRKDGRYIWVEAVSRALTQPAGQLRECIIVVRDVERRIAAEQRLKESEARYRLLADHSSDMVFQLDRNMVRQYVSPASREILGYEPEELVGINPVGMVHPEDAERVRSVFASLLAGEVERATVSNRIRHREGRWVWVEAELRLLRDAMTHAPYGIVGALRDISARKAAEDAVRVSEARYRLLADNTADFITCFAPDGRRIYASPACRHLLGYEPEEVLAMQPTDLTHPDDQPLLAEALERLQGGEAVDDFRCRARHRDGSYRWVEASGRKLPNGEGVLFAVRDISKRKQAEDRLEEANRRLEALAAQDSLTSLANRRSFDEALEIEHRRAMREAAHLGLIMLDVDNFKAFNDVYGHPAGDECLRAVSRAVRSALRRPGDLAARYGGEELVVLLPNTDEAGAALIAQRIRLAVRAMRLEHRTGAKRIVTVSAGVASMIPTQPTDSPDALLRSADLALYVAKRSGRDAVVCASQTERDRITPGSSVA
ncbi:MAG: PAS domain S-box protein [Methylobacteriaceae bacterium]|nr:PAS domain S-box protein [Methylobacteriaceae bacterium]